MNQQWSMNSCNLLSLRIQLYFVAYTVLGKFLSLIDCGLIAHCAALDFPQLNLSTPLKEE